MRIGFDLDGVLFESIEYNGNLKEYNNQISKPKLRLDIDRLLCSNKHDIYIITGRAKDNEGITRKTLKLFLPQFNLNNLIMVNEFDSSKIDIAFSDVVSYRTYIAVRKFIYIIDLKLDYYFEDNPLIIKILKNVENKSGYRIIDVNDVSSVNKILDICTGVL